MAAARRGAARRCAERLGAVRGGSARSRAVGVMNALSPLSVFAPAAWRR